jgi:isocitrate lyase
MSKRPWATAELAQRFKTDGMLAYVETVQRKEKEIGCDVLMHQKWYALPFTSAGTIL